MKLADRWLARWPEALRAWGRFVNVHPPTMFTSDKAARGAGLVDSFASFALDRRAVQLNLAAVERLGLTEFAVEVMAHEVGHHVLCPADLADHGQLLVRVRRGLGPLADHAPMVANLYADILINDRLQRSRGLRMAAVYQQLGAGSDSSLWTFYVRTYEILWSLTAGTLTGGPVDPAMDGDAQLAAKLVRVYATEWVDGAGGFAALCVRYLREDVKEHRTWLRLCQGALGSDAHIPGLTGGDDGGEIVHPALDPRVNEFADAPASAEPASAVPPKPSTTELSGGQTRQPFEYGQLLRQLGLPVSTREVAIRYYRELAMPQLVPFPVRHRTPATEPLPEGLGLWDVGEPLEAVDWLASTLRSPVVVPGITTVQRLQGTMEGSDRDARPVDLDLYVDSSGSMPNPASRLSHLTLAGAILALSALRVGARVQATLWSGTTQFTCTDGFVRDERAVLGILTSHFGGATAFPLHVLRDTYARRRAPTHIVVISDDGVDTMIRHTDERGTPGGEIAAAALSAAGAGGTLLLRLHNERAREHIAGMTPGWDVHRVTNWDELVAFAAAFSRRTYERNRHE
jgi:hypothetical protein